MKLKCAEEKLHEFDLITETRELSNVEKLSKRETRDGVWNWSKMQEWIWLPKSRLNWAHKGDKNTRFFHVMASCRQNRNAVGSLKFNGIVYDEPVRVKHEVLNFFKAHFTEVWSSRPKLMGNFKSISSTVVADQIEAEFSKAEIWAAVRSCDGNKAPGPDEINMLFFKKCWKVVKKEVLQFMQDFHQYGKLVGGLNSSFITLVPKKDNPISLGDYRPISLIRSLYKIISKVLANKIKLVIPSIISEEQSAFVEGRSILDGILIANEIVDWWKKTKRRGIILKLDFEKAYDSVNWSFLLAMMKNLGFGAKWLSWVQECISNIRVSVLVNGSPTSEFSPSRGIRQGDPLSPFLFNIVVEGLNILLTRARELNLFKGGVIGANEISVSHLQFADDSIIFCEANWEEVMNIKRVLRCFEMISGLRINYHKSVISGIGVQDDLLAAIAGRLNCKCQKRPFKYLGMPLGANPGRLKTWKPIVDRVKVKLASWKRRFLSLAGRLTLIKAILSSLPVYYLSLFKMPEGVARELDKIQAAFLWGWKCDQEQDTYG